MNRPVVQVLVDDVALPPVLNGALQRVSAELTLSTLAADPSASNRKPVDARVVLTSDAGTLLTEKAGRLARWLEHDPVATLVMSDHPVGEDVLPTVSRDDHELAITWKPSEDELAGRLGAMCGMGRLLRRYRREAHVSESRAGALRQRIETLDRENRMASTLQRELLPKTLPAIREADLAVLYEPADLVAGDLYDVFRLDDDHIGIYLIDATGHGIAAALVASFAARLLRPDVDALSSADMLAPDLPLKRMNAALHEADLQECHFVAALYAVFNERTRVFRWARGGGCYPILARRGVEPKILRSAGPLVSINANPRFQVAEVRLKPGDSIFLHTDGMERLPAPSAVTPQGENIAHVDWLRSVRQGVIIDALTDIASRVHESSASNRDDITVVALQSHPMVSAPASLVMPSAVKAAQELACT